MRIGRISFVVDQGEHKPRVKTMDVYPTKKDAEAAQQQSATELSSSVPETMEKITAFVADKDKPQGKKEQ